MSNASEQWTKECKFKALGLNPPADNTELLPYSDEYITKFLVPATWMTSGKDKSEFNFNKAYKGDQAALAYLAQQVDSQSINKLISVMNSNAPTPAWMIYFPKLMDYYKYDGLLNTSIKSANKAFIDAHKLSFGVCYANGSDIQVVVNNDGSPIDGYPNNIYVYTEEEIKEFGIRVGTTTIPDLLKKEWWKYTNAEAALLQKAKFLKKDDFKSYPAPVIYQDGTITEISVNYLSEERPPIEVMAIYESLPQSIVEHCGTKIHAFVDLASSGDITLQDTAAKKYLSEVKKILADGKDTMAVVADEDSVAKLIQESGYVTMSFDEALRGYLNDYSLDENITVKDLLKYMETDDDSFVPEPFNKEAFRQQVIKEEQISKEEVEDEDVVFLVAGKLEQIEMPKAMVDNIVNCIINKTPYESESPETHIILEKVGFTHGQIGEIINAYEKNEKFDFSNLVAYQMRIRGADEQMIADMQSVLNGNVTFAECKSFAHNDPFNVAVGELTSAGYSIPEAKGLLGGNSKPVMTSELTACGYSDEMINAITAGDTVAIAHKLFENVFSDSTEEQKLLDCLKENKSYVVEKPSVDADAVVQESLEGIGMDADMIGRIKLAMSSGTPIDLAPTAYVDIFDKVGATMLRRVRETISANSSYESRSSVTDVMFAYFRVLMGREDNMPDILEGLEQKSSEAKPAGKAIIDEAIQMLKEG